MIKLYQLIYSSMCKTQLCVEDLDYILKVSRINNVQVDITGMLLYQQGSFIQVLEGPQKAVQATFTKIEKDPRHHSVTVLYQDHCEQRDFPTWAMAFHGFDSNESEGLSDFLHPYKSKDEANISEGAAKQLLSRFKQINQR
ncbi:BLUF domain-containing protein [Paraglaciecola aestuariivivens]